jgi:hypothetical protein
MKRSDGDSNLRSLSSKSYFFLVFWMDEKDKVLSILDFDFFWLIKRYWQTTDSFLDHCGPSGFYLVQSSE